MWRGKICCWSVNVFWWMNFSEYFSKWESKRKRWIEGGPRWSVLHHGCWSFPVRYAPTYDSRHWVTYCCRCRFKVSNNFGSDRYTNGMGCTLSLRMKECVRLSEAIATRSRDSALPIRMQVSFLRILTFLNLEWIALISKKNIFMCTMRDVSIRRR